MPEPSGAADRIGGREAGRACRFCGKPGPYFGRCAEHWDIDDGMDRSDPAGGPCHCGSLADGHLTGFCDGCSLVRCDAFPGACAPKDTAMAVQAWRTVEVKATAFPRDPFGDEQWERVAEGLHLMYGDDGPGFGSSCGVWEFSFHDAVPADVRAGQVAGLLVGLEIEAEVAGRVVWTVMRFPVPVPGDAAVEAAGSEPVREALNVTVACKDGLWIAQDLDRQGCWASDPSRDGALTALGRAQAAYDMAFRA